MLKRKGIILAGGHGSRLKPITTSLSKQLLPIYNKPMIYYSLSTLMLSDIRDILIISQKKFIPLYKDLLGNGSHLGLRIKYAIQDIPKGIADAFNIGKNFVGKSKVALVLGDNIFYGSNLSSLLVNSSNSNEASLFSTKVRDPRQFGVIKYNKNHPIKIIEKPSRPPSQDAITGLYFYNNDVLEIVKKINPSKRGELEITDINNYYLERNEVKINKLPRGTLWLDTGTFENLHQCSQIVYSIEKNTEIKISCIEEIALKKKWIGITEIKKIIRKFSNNEYSQYLEKLI